MVWSLRICVCGRGESRLPVSVREWCLNTGRTPSVVLHFAPKPQGSNDLPPLHFISLPSLVPWPKGEKSIKTKAWSKKPKHKHAICTGLRVSMTTAGYGCLCTIVLIDGTLNCRINDGFEFHESHDIFKWNRYITHTYINIYLYLLKHRSISITLRVTYILFSQYKNVTHTSVLKRLNLKEKLWCSSLQLMPQTLKT